MSLEWTRNFRCCRSVRVFLPVRLSRVFSTSYHLSLVLAPTISWQQAFVKVGPGLLSPSLTRHLVVEKLPDLLEIGNMYDREQSILCTS